MSILRRNRQTQNRNRTRNRRHIQRPTQQNHQGSRFHTLPFARAFFDFVQRNRGKEISLLLGIGTSGSRNVRELALFTQEQMELHEDRRFFLLMIDTEYENEEPRRVSLEPLEEMGYERIATEQAVHPTGTSVFLWGATLPTAYSPIEKYIELRDNLEGPYQYGQQCSFTQDTQDFYDSLLSFIQVPLFRTIYVYNQGYYNTRQIEYVISRGNYYQGPSFRNIPRIQRQTENELRRRTRYNISPMLTIGMYFENFCELLYCLSRSGKPVFLLKQEDGILSFTVLYRSDDMMGGKKRRNRTTQSYRRATR